MRSRYWNVSAVREYSRNVKLAKINSTRHRNWLCTRWEGPGRENEKGWNFYPKRVKSSGISEKRWRCRARSSLPDHRLEDGGKRTLRRAKCSGHDGVFVIYTRNGAAGIALWLSRKYSFGFVERNNSRCAIKATWLSATRIHLRHFRGLSLYYNVCNTVTIVVNKEVK